MGVELVVGMRDWNGQTPKRVMRHATWPPPNSQTGAILTLYARAVLCCQQTVAAIEAVVQRDEVKSHVASTSWLFQSVEDMMRQRDGGETVRVTMS